MDIQQGTQNPGESGDSVSPCDFDSDKLIMKLRVSLSAERKAVDPVVRNVMEIVRDMQCATGKEDDIELALTEALANAVVHVLVKPKQRKVAKFGPFSTTAGFPSPF